MKFREATEADADGGGFPFALIGKPPRPGYKWKLRDIPLIARPPLLAVMQGGECACSKLVHTPPLVRPLSIHPLQATRDRSGKAHFQKFRSGKKGLPTTKLAQNGVSGSISSW